MLTLEFQVLSFNTIVDYVFFPFKSTFWQRIMIPLKLFKVKRMNILTTHEIPSENFQQNQNSIFYSLPCQPLQNFDFSFCN